MPQTETDAAQSFVVRRSRWETSVGLLYLGLVVFGLMVLLTIGCVVFALVRDEPVRGPLEAVWLSLGGMPLIFAVGLPVLLGVGWVTTAESRHEDDSEDVLLALDSEGVYLGGDQPHQLPWDQVHGICRVERRDVGPDGDEAWHAHLIVLKHPDAELPRLSKNWGPSCDWPGGLLTKTLSFAELEAAVARYAPHVAVTDRGRVAG
ncbi:hypothetical protein Kfla_2362 [Kribbella flavida DSM 17836]|uniref:Uncharacterized protein n=1 Tax=Kribbella flavida (strain DSM 17836 / JCM 10339 / NBRC 14399) TaxID=479435 RepID=D2PUX1_KRIFD|nr:hypothetical protein [Kribbella flavida]ADB31437.1 hypothetical protein Kfla_2362 [Kribbella flavida DSM 17836]